MTVSGYRWHTSPVPDGTAVLDVFPNVGNNYVYYLYGTRRCLFLVGYGGSCRMRLGFPTRRGKHALLWLPNDLYQGCERAPWRRTHVASGLLGSEPI